MSTANAITLLQVTFVPHTSAIMFVSLGSVFLGLLFGLRYHAALEGLDRILQDAGEPGLTPGQVSWLKTIRSATFGGIGVFLATLLIFLFIGVDAHNPPKWPFLLACGGHLVMSAGLMASAAADIRSRVVRPWLRTIVLMLGIAGTLGAPAAAFTLEPNLLAPPTTQEDLPDQQTQP